MTQSDFCEVDYVRSEEINHHISAVTSSSWMVVAADLSSSKAAAVLELSSADSHHHLVKCSTSTDVAAKTPVKRPKF